MFTQEILKKRVERAYSALTEFDAELWVIIGRETYYAGEPGLKVLMPADVMCETAVVISKGGQSVCLIKPGEAEEVIAYGAFDRVIQYEGTHWGSNFEEELFRVIRSFNPKYRIALNYSLVDPSADGLTRTYHQMVMRCLDRINYAGETVSAANIMKRVRGQKCKEEIDGIEHAVLTSMGIYEESRNYIRKGISGRDIQKYFQQKVSELGADYSWPKVGNPFVSVGTKSSYLCKRPPDNIFLEGGDLVNVDFGLRVDDFGTDNQRSFYVLGEGESACPAEVQNAFEAVQSAIKAAVNACAPGVFASVPLDRANEVFVSRGFPTVGGLGHEFGYCAHEGGMRCGTVYPYDELDQNLEAGLTFTMEPAIITSHGRLCQEESILITASGARFLSPPQKEVWLVR